MRQQRKFVAKPTQLVCSANRQANGQVAKLTCRPAVTQKKPLVKAASVNPLTRYVQGGAPNGGTGSKQNPWNNLADAEANDWTTLVILPSATVLYGGITLFDGQTLRGQQKNQALLANLDAASHNGDVIVVQGNVTIKNLTIVTAWRSAIEALEAENLTVSDIVIQRSNPSGLFFYYDLRHNSTTEVSNFYWPAISFFGGPTETQQLQPLNKHSGLFLLEKSIVDNYLNGVIVGSGDNQASQAIPPTYNREYRIVDTEFRSSDPNNELMGNAIVPYAGPGSILSGVINRSIFRNLTSGEIRDAWGIQFTTTRSNINYPGRAQLTLGTNTVKNSFFENIEGFGAYFLLQGDLLGTKGKLIVDNNTFTNVGNTPALVNVPASIEYRYSAIVLEIGRVGSGSVQFSVTDNEILDPSGLAGGITTYLDGGSIAVNGSIRRNLIDGPSTGINFILGYFDERLDAIARYHVANNKIVNVDTAIFAAGSTDRTNDVEIIVENNCFENTGNRQAQLGRNPDYDPTIPVAAESYYGGTIVYGGGLSNSAVQNAGVNRPSTGIVLDLGGGELGSRGNNSFIRAIGPHTWVEEGLFLSAEHNWFGGDEPRDAGAGGQVDFEPQRQSGPRHCVERKRCSDKHSSSSSCSRNSKK